MTAAGGNSGVMKAAVLRRCLAVAVLLATAAAISACGWVEWPPPRGAFAMKRPAPTLANPPLQNADSTTQAGVPGAVIVERGDTVYGLERKYGVPQRAIIEANNLSPPYHLRTGQRITLPATRQHIVKRGETIYSISRIYGVDSYTLASANGLSGDAPVQPGQSLKLPAASASPAVAALSAAPTSPVPTVEAAPISVAPLPSPALPGAPPAPSPGSTASVFMPDGPPATAETAPAAGLETPRSLPEPSPAAAPPVQVNAPKTAAVLPAPPSRSGGFIWPVTGGKVISGFGPAGEGQYNNGINIAAPRGTPIRAAENGVVAYSGNELSGLGNVLLIKHSDDWVTFYSHADALLVGKGDTVKKGDVIARVGSTGKIDKPQLHFELRQNKGKRPVDPQRYLRDGSVSRAEPVNPAVARDGRPSPG